VKSVRSGRQTLKRSRDLREALKVFQKPLRLIDTH